ncbi:sugar kinase [Proteocatella sphenisci]|uniref:sugar kinase n=1 Tax=Proteocatella sphenisci TaxID=181070 RepID=UPI0004BAD4AA|nr:sugar kinase [Proteocatella sphenisci]
MKVITFGEILLRLAPQGHKKLFQNDIFETSFCGAEANVAVSLANYGIDSCFVTKVPDNEVGQATINSLRYFGVDTTKVIKGGERLGLYYLEKGASQRPSKVLYDRASSAIANSIAKDFDWDQIFDDVEWFHFSGINPALSESMSNISLEACKAAKDKGITISCDLNYRSKLWTKDQAKETMSGLMNYVDVCIGNEEDADNVFGIRANNTDVLSGSVDHKSYEEVAKKISNQFGCKYVAITLRTSLSASSNKWAGMLYSSNEDKYALSKEYMIDIVDRVGSGDSFAAGIIYSLLNKATAQDAVEFAVAASCLKHTQEGDFNRVSVNDVKALVDGDSSGRVKR